MLHGFQGQFCVVGWFATLRSGKDKRGGCWKARTARKRRPQRWKSWRHIWLPTKDAGHTRQTSRTPFSVVHRSQGRCLQPSGCDFFDCGVLWVWPKSTLGLIAPKTSAEYLDTSRPLAQGWRKGQDGLLCSSHFICMFFVT